MPTHPYRSSGVSAPSNSSSTAVSWGPIIAGAFAASTLTFILMLLGSGLGLRWCRHGRVSGASITTFAVSTAIWLIVVQWLSSGVGGYLTGRLRTKWVGVHTDEVYFRDTAHGFLAWALATLLVVGVLGSALSPRSSAAAYRRCRPWCRAPRWGYRSAASGQCQRRIDRQRDLLPRRLLFRPADPASSPRPAPEAMPRRLPRLRAS